MNSSKNVTYSISTGTIVKVLLILALAGLVFYLREIVLIILTAVVIASAIEPATSRLVKMRFPRFLAVLIIYLASIVLLIGFFYLVLPTFITDFAGFMSMLPKHITALNVKTSGLGSDFFGLQSAVQGLSKSESIGQGIQNLISSVSTATGSILEGLTAVFGGVTSFIFIFFISFYLAVQDKGVEEFLALVTPLKYEEYVINVWQRTETKIGRWIQGQLLLALIIGIIVFVALSILHVKNPFFLALISAAFEIVPVFGPFLGSLPGIMVAFLQSGITFGLIVALTYIIIMQLESNVIYPLIVKRFLNLPPLLVIIALIIGARLGGFLGIILSVPLSAACMELLNDWKRDRSAARTVITTEVSIENV